MEFSRGTVLFEKFIIKTKEVEIMKIAIAGIGYVGMSMAVLLSQKNEVVAYDILPEKIEKINKKQSPIKDKEISDYLKNKDLNLRGTLDYKDAFEDAKFIIICTPTDYDEEKNFFDTSSVEDIIKKVKSDNLDTTVIIKSTVPVGFTQRIKHIYEMNNIIFSPEFLREGKALYDNLYPSRIIIGDNTEKAEQFANLLVEGAQKKDITVKYMNNTEAEAVKLFSNTYLALRIAFFNELDTYAEMKGLNTKNIIDGVTLDSRIGNFYNNPSFGYGGYCLPKDTKQLLVNYEDIPQNLIGAIINSNQTRKKHITDMVIEKKPKTIGVYKLTMKTDSDNFRNSAMNKIIEDLKDVNSNIIVYEPTLKSDEFNGCKVVNNFNDFTKESDLILANRFEPVLQEFQYKVYTRDLYNRD